MSFLFFFVKICLAAAALSGIIAYIIAMIITVAYDYSNDKKSQSERI